jgi:hypothetical protein
MMKASFLLLSPHLMIAATKIMDVDHSPDHGSERILMLMKIRPEFNMLRWRRMCSESPALRVNKFDLQP